MAAYYNENDPHAAAWLRELIKAGLITDGVVDERSIKDVRADDVVGFDRVHWFAGIGGWDYALNLAGWGDVQVWTGSCPCQPFSAAGKRKGTADERHLWPELRRLVGDCRPAICFGEQVAGKDGVRWLSGVRADLEEIGYAVGAADLPAASVAAPHRRHRLFWVADAGHDVQSRAGQRRGLEAEERRESSFNSESCSVALGLGNPVVNNLGRISGSPPGAKAEGDRERFEHGAGRLESRFASAACGMGDADSIGQSPIREIPGGARTHGSGSPWGASESILCRDGKRRRVPSPESGIFPLAYGIPGRVGLLRGYGNAIVPQVAAEFIQAYLETQDA